AIVALSINSSAYIAEILRSGIQSVDKGQMEASRSLGFDYSTSMRLVIIPQALKNVLPALANEFIVLVKESSIVSVIGIQDLMYSADIVKGNTYL
ncbi:amino acid ABC transporter permease, partial [Clostridium perfringens]